MRLAAGEALDDTWYEVIGYDTKSARPAIVLRHAGAEWAPAVHADLQPGDLVDVIIGPEARDHRGTMRIFHRADGRGRFVLREAQTKPENQDEQHQLALSLNRRTQGLLAGLVEGASLPARVIPRPQAGCATITFLELLHAHWNSRVHRYQKFDVPQAGGRTASRRYYPGAVASDPNDFGYATVESLVRDSARGIVHLMGVRVSDPDKEPGDALAARLSVGAPLLVQVRPEVVRLPIGGQRMAAVRKIAEDYPTHFHPVPPGNSIVLLTCRFRLRGWCGDGWLSRCCSRSSVC